MTGIATVTESFEEKPTELVSLFSISMMLHRDKYVPKNSWHEVTKHFRGRQGNLSDSDDLFLMYELVDVAFNPQS